ncbi:quinone oxidoreductase family protein [Actinacidiphila guanduensis]|uniref:NADPH2:quinone reductase n=1 Tax=Actinacidiphila guanduensis TaxID=310781 RepID=A0A1H0S927_9ACTN|nr:zinc-binding dehydrogenase [Actinacidiphila guanduensis]SDP38167.1 NADPH2:quinone reductase [Actinacidiphila guanduensis]
MRAIVIEEFGGPEVLTLAALPEPEPGPGELTVDVAWIGVNFVDTLARSAGYRVPGLPFRPGVEVSGTVRATGPGVTGFAPGQEVAAFVTDGGYSEVARVRASTAFVLPPGVDLRTGATLPIVLPTAWGLLHEVGRVREGDVVLIHSAAGGVGTVAGQLARSGGAAAVYGVVSDLDKSEHALKSGYDRVFTADTFDTDVKAATDGRGVDLALDPVSGETFHRTLAVLARFGRLVSYGNAGLDEWQISRNDCTPMGISVGGFSILALAADAPERLREIAGRAFHAFAEGVVELPVSAEFALEDAAEAHRLMESRTTTGKLLLRV